MAPGLNEKGEELHHKAIMVARVGSRPAAATASERHGKRFARRKGAVTLCPDAHVRLPPVLMEHHGGSAFRECLEVVYRIFRKSVVRLEGAHEGCGRAVIAGRTASIGSQANMTPAYAASHCFGAEPGTESIALFNRADGGRTYDR
jgi:hypothetical protein